MGVGGHGIVQVAHMFDATEQVGVGAGGYGIVKVTHGLTQ